MTDSKHNPADTRTGGPKVGSDQGRGILDPAWEDELRRGQEEEGEAGSVEDELAYLHLLRHAREPEGLAGDQLDSLWSAIESDIGAEAGTPWWRKAWIWWSAPALAAAAVLIVVVVQPGGQDEATVARQDQAPASEAQRAKSGTSPSAASADESLREGAPAPEASAAPSPEAAEEEAKAEPDDAIADGMFGRGGGGKERATGTSPFELSFAKLAPNGRLAIRASVDTSRDELRSQLLAKARGGG